MFIAENLLHGFRLERHILSLVDTETLLPLSEIIYSIAEIAIAKTIYFTLISVKRTLLGNKKEFTAMLELLESKISTLPDILANIRNLSDIK